MVLFVAVLSFSALFINRSCCAIQGLFEKDFLSFLHLADKEAGLTPLSFGP